jgi:hypothetical protein
MRLLKSVDGTRPITQGVGPKIQEQIESGSGLNYSAAHDPVNEHYWKLRHVDITSVSGTSSESAR